MAALKDKELYRLLYKVDGKISFAELFAKGERLVGLAVPTKEAHRFSGWKDLPARMPAEDLTIEGTFEPLAYRLTFVCDGREISSSEVLFGAPIVAPKLPRKEGFEFSGWDNLPETMPAEDLTVSGKFLKDSYSLTYIIEDKHRFTVPLPYGAPIEPMEYPSKPNHVFSGWEGLPTTMPAEDLTVSGRFEMKSFKLVRIVDGEIFMSEELRIGDKINKKAKPVKPGFYFSGWRNLPDTMPDHDITAITSMYPARFRVDYEIDGEIWRSNYVPYTAEFVAEDPEDRPGFRFLGWEDVPATMPMHDIVIRGSYAAVDVVVPDVVEEPAAEVVEEPAV
jgi:hypothetical protein